MQRYNLAPTLFVAVDSIRAGVQSPQLAKKPKRDGIGVVHNGLGVKLDEIIMRQQSSDIFRIAVFKAVMDVERLFFAKAVRTAEVSVRGGDQQEAVVLQHPSVSLINTSLSYDQVGEEWERVMYTVVNSRNRHPF